MAQRIDRDSKRFEDILKGRVRKDLRKYIVEGKLIGRKGKDLISIPIPHIVSPKFRFGENVPDVGQGDGEVGDVIGSSPGDGNGSGKAGNAPGYHIIEVEFSIEELAEMLGENLKLPRLKPRGKKNLRVAKHRYTKIRPIGPEGLRINKRSFKRALLRNVQSLEPEDVVSEDFDISNYPIQILPRDKRYRAPKTVFEESSAAVIILMRDVSGSIGEEQKEIVRIETFWIETWLKHCYKSVEMCYIVHDTGASIVDSEKFYGFTSSGGTKISSCYELCARLIHKGVGGLIFSPTKWNIYPFHFSDGENWDRGDNEKCRAVLQKYIVPHVNQFSYSQIKGMGEHGSFIAELISWFPDNPIVSVAALNGKEDIPDALRTHLSTGL